MRTDLMPLLVTRDRPTIREVLAATRAAGTRIEVSAARMDAGTMRQTFSEANVLIIGVDVLLDVHQVLNGRDNVVLVATSPDWEKNVAAAVAGLVSRVATIQTVFVPRDQNQLVELLRGVTRAAAAA
jgi:hypothetical protein